VGLIAFVIKLGLVPYALPSMMPTWRWWLGAVLTGGGLLLAFWILDGGLADVLGVLIGVIVTISFASGAIVRAMTLVMSARGVGPGYSIAVTAAGFGIMVAVLVLPILL
jgi:hypothetical protein